MFFTVFIAVLSVVIVGLSLLAIVMSTSHGSAWVQSVWQARTDEHERDDRPDA